MARFGVRGTVGAGTVAATAGLLLFTGIHPGANYFAVVLPGGVLSGIGMGLGLVGSTIAASHTRAAIGATHAAALTDGFVAAFEVGAALCATGAALALLLLRGPANAERVADVVDERVEEREALAAVIINR